MTHEEAIRVLKGDFAEVELKEGESHSDVFASAFNMAIMTLEKQTPKKPIWRWNGNETVIECPNCGKYPFDLSEYEWARIFCGHCGQRIDWNEVE